MGIDRVITPLLKLVEDKTVLQNLFVVGEKGGSWLNFSNNGECQNKKEIIQS